ncbi:MAG: MarR family winged helix-turn-helix transcriptional regulator [Candidatus Kapaibacterium sp.]
MVSQKQVSAFTQVLRQVGLIFMRVAGQQSHAHANYNKQELLALSILGASGACRMGEISEHLGVGQSAVTPIVDRLESQELVQRKRSDQDRRVWLVELTEKGKEVVAGEDEIYQQVATEMLAPLKAAERDMLIKLLQRVGDIGSGSE